MASSLSEIDQALIWHPYTQHKLNKPPIAITRGQGVFLYDEEANAYLDAISSWWVNIHGHGHPYIAEKIHEQALKLEHVIFTGFTHEPAVFLAKRLMPILPGNFSKLFYSDNGSTAVEVAIKMAIQYWSNKSGPKGRRRKKILALNHSYHGDTFGAMSVSDRSIFTLPFQEWLFEVQFVDAPAKENIAKTKNLIDQMSEEICCFIYEPLLQGAGGMKIYEAEALDELLVFLKSKGIICIADEVLTGFGRTGKMFAGEYLNTKADIICLSKGLTGGSMALGATATTEEIYEAFLSDDRTLTFFHGHSFTANPIACSAALASLDLFEKESTLQKVSFLSQENEKFKLVLQDPGLKGIKNPRSIGTILAFELESGRDGYLNTISSTIAAEAIKNGIFLRPLGNTVYIMPPYCINEKQLQVLYQFLLSLAN